MNLKKCVGERKYKKNNLEYDYKPEPDFERVLRGGFRGTGFCIPVCDWLSHISGGWPSSDFGWWISRGLEISRGGDDVISDNFRLRLCFPLPKLFFNILMKPDPDFRAGSDRTNEESAKWIKS